MLKYGIVLVGLFGLGLLCSVHAEEKSLNEALIPLSGGKTKGVSSGYYFVNINATWDDAKKYCLDAGLALLTIETKLKQGQFERYLDASYIKELEGLTFYGWTAGTDRRSTGGQERYYWFPRDKDDTWATQYWNFASEPPCDAGTTCIAISNVDTAASFGKWYPLSCDTKTVFFCQTAKL